MVAFNLHRDGGSSLGSLIGLGGGIRTIVLILKTVLVIVGVQMIYEGIFG